ncbi:MAG: hypothetical protein JXJ30_10480 [Halothiobacillaceae bacterium]|nr:hypothetical protein [Halothiobacillaceae bacterium]HER19462.1 hypothetical protein [Chromatiales bacterium]
MAEAVDGVETGTRAADPERRMALSIPRAGTSLGRRLGETTFPGSDRGGGAMNEHGRDNTQADP